MSSGRDGLSSLPFTVVRKGYDKDEVCAYFERFDSALRGAVTERDAARSRAAELEAQLARAHRRIAELEGEVAR
jgi:hypothetical protein